MSQIRPHCSPQHAACDADGLDLDGGVVGEVVHALDPVAGDTRIRSCLDTMGDVAAGTGTDDTDSRHRYCSHGHSHRCAEGMSLRDACGSGCILHVDACVRVDDVRVRVL
jgi:hypothetical protein